MTKKINYTLGFNVSGYCEVELSGSSKEEIIKKANNLIYEKDFGDLMNIDWELNNIEGDEENE